MLLDNVRKTEIPLLCKSCGCEDHGIITDGKGPHKWQALCAHCGRHIKWLSDLAVEPISIEYAIARVKEYEWAAIVAAKAGNMPDFYKNIAMRDKYNERL